MKTIKNNCSTDILQRFIYLKNLYPGLSNEHVCEALAQDVLESIGIPCMSVNERNHNKDLIEALTNMFTVGYKVAQTTFIPQNIL